MIYKTFEEWKAGQWLEDGEPRTKAYTEDELLLIKMGWKYGVDAGKAKDLTDEEIDKVWDLGDKYLDIWHDGTISAVLYYDFARAILKKASEK